MPKTMTRNDWARFGASLPKQGLHFIEGKYLTSRDGRVLDCISPIDGAVIATLARGGAAEIDLAVASGLKAWRDGRWSGLAPRSRMEIMMRWADLVEASSSELALLETLDMGKPITDVLTIDIPEVLRTIRYFAECIDKIEGAVTNTVPGTLHMITHEPLGVVGAITPWNYPLLMAVWKLAPALAAGNSIVLKPSELAPLSCTRLAALFVEAGGPPGVFNLVNGTGEEAGTPLALHNDVAKLTFTGSTRVGKLLLGYSGQSNMKRVALETGGKSPQIFMPDLYDLDAAVDRAIGGIYDNAGQVCNAGSRLLVHRSLKDRFLDKFVARTKALYRPGDPLDPATTLGPVSSHQHRQGVEAHIHRALAEGAALAMGGRDAPANGTAAFVSPHLVIGVTQESSIVRDEVFGPVASLQTFETEAEAIAMANDSVYGLAASVWTSDLNTAHRVLRQLQAGVVWVNCFGDGDMTQPFGGYKQSGNSRDKHMDCLKGYMQTKSAWLQIG